MLTKTPKYPFPQAMRRALRLHWTTESTYPLLIGIALAWKDGYCSIFVATLLLVNIFIAHVMMELYDDLIDFKLAGSIPAWRQRSPRTPFAGGSGILKGAHLSSYHVLLIMLTLAPFYYLSGILVVLNTDWKILLFTLVGLFLAYGYATPPFRLSARGLGELVTFFCFGPLITVASYQTMILTHEDSLKLPLPMDLILLSLVPGLFSFAMIHIEELIDMEEDLATGKRTLVIIFGPRYATAAQLCAVLVSTLLVIYAGTALHPAYFIATPFLVSAIVEAAWFFRNPHNSEGIVSKVKTFNLFKLKGRICLSLIGATILTRIFRSHIEVNAIWLILASWMAHLPAKGIADGRQDNVDSKRFL